MHRCVEKGWPPCLEPHRPLAAAAQSRPFPLCSGPSARTEARGGIERTIDASTPAMVGMLFCPPWSRHPKSCTKVSGLTGQVVKTSKHGHTRERPAPVRLAKSSQRSCRNRCAAIPSTALGETIRSSLQLEEVSAAGARGARPALRRATGRRPGKSKTTLRSSPRWGRNHRA